MTVEDVRKFLKNLPSDCEIVLVDELNGMHHDDVRIDYEPKDNTETDNVVMITY